MYFLERKEPIARPNILGNCSFPVYTERWKAIACCEEKEPLEKELETLDKKNIELQITKANNYAPVRYRGQRNLI